MGSWDRRGYPKSRLWTPLLPAALLGSAALLGCSSGPNLISTPPDITPAASTATPPPPVVDGDERLTRKVEPLAYRLKFEIDPREDQFRGATEIQLRVHEATRTLRLHALGLDFSEVFAVRSGAANDKLRARLIPGKNAGLALVFDEPLEGEILLEFSYAAPLDEIPMSLYRARDGDEWYAFTQFEALAAREAFPCFDEPQFKTPFTTSIITPASMKAASNAPLARTTPIGDQVRYDFETTEPLPTYLVAMAVGNFDIAQNAAPRAGQPPQRILTVHGKSQHTAFALRESSTILAELSEYFGSPYPYKKLDQVAVPSFRAGAMENAGLVTYREQFLIIDDARGSANDKLQAQSIIAHELAHMWFGNLVTMQWWDDLWLNEAFATWMSNVVLKKIAPAAEPELQAVKSMVEIMDQDGLTSATPVRKRIQNSGDIDNAFDRITYVKGLSVLRMLEQWVGPERFRDGIRKYLERHAWKNATTFDLFDALDGAAERPVSPIARAFIETPGVPLVEVDWSCNEGQVEFTLRQQRYLPRGVDAPPQTWSVPVCLKAGGRGRTERECFLFDQKSEKRTPGWGFCPSFVHPNAGEASYYRWQLEPERFLALTREFRSELTAAERVALPSHAFALLEAGVLDGPGYLAALEALGADDHRLVLEGVLDGLGKLNRTLTAPAEREALARFTRRLLAPHAKRIGFVPRAGEPVSVSLVRSRVFQALGGIGNDPETLKTANQVAQQVLRDPEQVAPDLAAQSLALAALGGDAELHAGLVELLGATRSPSLRDAVVRALAAFRDPDLLGRTYALLLNGTLRAQDYYVLPRAAGRDAATQAVYWAWYVKHEQDLIRLLGARVSASLPWVVAGFCSEIELQTARAFFVDPEALGPGARHNLNQALETATRCLNLRQAVLPTLKPWLAEMSKTR